MTETRATRLKKQSLDEEARLHRHDAPTGLDDRGLPLDDPCELAGQLCLVAYHLERLDREYGAAESDDALFLRGRWEFWDRRRTILMDRFKRAVARRGTLWLDTGVTPPS
jgi:hypothetical protein